VDAAFDRALCDATASLGITLSPDQREKLWSHREHVVETNKQFNLTRITDPEAFAVKHHADSLSVVAWVEKARIRVRRVLDIGTGAGVPAVPIAVAMPKWRVTAIDSTQKKANFVGQLAGELSLDNLEAKQVRAEEWRYARPFDLVVLKGVGSLARCIEFARLHVAPDQLVAMYKSRSISDEEVAEGRTAAEKTGLRHIECFDYELPLEGETLKHSLWVFRRHAARGF
jgi:16S rRNA (guanine527-N7)-methyltransferase